MAAFQARPRALAQPSASLLAPTSDVDPLELERPQSPSSSLHFGDDELGSYRDSQRGGGEEVPESEKEWIVFKPRSPPSPIPESEAGDDPDDATPRRTDVGEGMLASGWTSYHSTQSDGGTSQSRVYLPMPRHDGSGRFSVPSPSLSSTSRLSNAHQSTALDTSIYASVPSQMLAPPRSTDSRRQGRTLSEGSYSSFDGAAADDDDDVLSLPSSLSLSQSWSENASPALRPATTSLEASTRSTRTRGASATASSISLLSAPTSPLLGQEGTQLTASALSNVPLARVSSSARVVWTSDSDNGVDSEDDGVEVTSQDARDDDELSRTPHAQSAGLGFSSANRNRIRRPPPRSRVTVSERSALTDRTNTTSASERVKRRHRRAAQGRVSEDGSTKRSATGREKERVASVHPKPETVVEEKEEQAKDKVDWVTRVARKVMDVDHETLRMIGEAQNVVPSATPKPAAKSRTKSTRVTLRTAPTRPITGRHARFSLGDSPMDLSGAYRARYDDSDCYDSDDDVTMSDAETEVEFHHHHHYHAHHRSTTNAAFQPHEDLSASVSTSVSTLRSRGAHGSPTHRSLSLSSIPAYLLNSLLGGPSFPHDLSPDHTEIRRTNSVLFKSPPAQSPEDAAFGDDPRASDEVLSSREQAVGYWRRVLRAWRVW